MQQEKTGLILPSLGNRPALYGELLNGNKENFFVKKDSEEATSIMKVVMDCLKEKMANEKKT